MVLLLWFRHLLVTLLTAIVFKSAFWNVDGEKIGNVGAMRTLNVMRSLMKTMRSFMGNQSAAHGEVNQCYNPSYFAPVTK